MKYDLLFKKLTEYLLNKCIAKKIPDTIWTIKHRPNKEPKFHKELIFEGDGNSTKYQLTIFNNGWIFKIDKIIINWSQFGLQDANSPIIEELIFTWFY